MISNLSRGPAVLWLVLYLFLQFGCLFANAQYTQFRIRNEGNTSVWVEGHLTIWIKNDPPSSSFSIWTDFNVQRTLTAGQIWNAYAVYWPGYGSNSYCRFEWNQTSPSRGAGVNLYGDYAYHNDGDTINHDHTVWAGNLNWYIPLRIINDTGWSVLYSVSTLSEPVATSGWVQAAPGAIINVCPGPFTNALRNWWVAVQDRELVAVDNMFTASSKSNVVYYSEAPAGYDLDCAPPTIINLSARWAQNPAPYGTMTGTGRIDWYGSETNMGAWVNTNLAVTAAVQVGAQAVVDAVNSLSNAIAGGGGGGGTVVVTNQVGFGEITNQLNSLTQHVAAIWRMGSNGFYADTNRLGGLFVSGPSSNDVWLAMTLHSNTAYANMLTAGGILDYDAPSVDNTTPSDGGFNFRGIGGYTIPLRLNWEGGGSLVDGVNIAWSGTCFSWLRSILTVGLVVGLWFIVYNEILESWWKVATTQQMKALRGDVMGTSLALPVSYLITGLIVAVLVTLPAALVGVFTGIAAAHSVGSMSSAIGGISGIATDSGVWGLVKLVMPWTVFWSCVASYVAWRVVRDTVTVAMSAMLKAWITD